MLQTKILQLKFLFFFISKATNLTNILHVICLKISHNKWLLVIIIIKHQASGFLSLHIHSINKTQQFTHTHAYNYTNNIIKLILVEKRTTK